MPKPLAESLLARLTTPARSSAIMGDLTELAATRGRFWFWINYLHTLILLTWRTPVAILAAVASIKYLRVTSVLYLHRVIASLFGATVIHPGDLQKWTRPHPHLAHFTWEVSWWTTLSLWIVFPYVVIRFGLRNRLTCLAGALLLFGLPIYSLRPQIFEWTGMVCALIVAAALLLAHWRRPMIFLLANCVAAYAVFYICVIDPLGLLHPHLYPMRLFHMPIEDPVGIAVMVLIGPPLYRWLLERPSAGDTTIA